VGWSRDRPV